MWRSYWGLNRDPFSDLEALDVPLPGQQEAQARLVGVVTSGQRWGLLGGPSGIGKTRVLRQLMSRLRDPRRRVVFVGAPAGGNELITKLARGLGIGVQGENLAGRAWLALEQAVRICAMQGQQIVFAVDDADVLFGPKELTGLYRLGRLGEVHRGLVTVLLATGEAGFLREPPPVPWSWSQTVQLKPLLLSEAREYLEAKLRASGCRDSLLSPRAVSRLHVLSRGIPRALDRVASLALMAAASRGLDIVSSELVDSLAVGDGPLSVSEPSWMGTTF